MYKQEIKENHAVIRRQDKLIVDLQQRNELSQNAVLVTSAQLGQKANQRDNLKMKMQELSDQRSYFCESIGALEEKVKSYKIYQHQ